jgi:hypothetical protein
VQGGGSNAQSEGVGDPEPIANRGSPNRSSDGVRLTHWKRVARSSQPESTRKGSYPGATGETQALRFSGDHKLVSLPRKERKSDSNGNAPYLGLKVAAEQPRF